MVIPLLQNQIGLVEFADLECRASEVPQGTLHCTGRICKTTPRHPGNICETFSSFLGGRSRSKTKGPLHLRKHDIVPFKKTVPFALHGRSSNKINIGPQSCGTLKVPDISYENGVFTCVCLSYLPKEPLAPKILISAGLFLRTFLRIHSIQSYVTRPTRQVGNCQEIRSSLDVCRAWDWHWQTRPAALNSLQRGDDP